MIQLWKFGLSKYDPFHPTVLPGQRRFMYDETLDAVDTLIFHWEPVSSSSPSSTLILHVGMAVRGIHSVLAEVRSSVHRRDHDALACNCCRQQTPTIL
jgi:hypothetical protein